jgi:hypothetical protein
MTPRGMSHERIGASMFMRTRLAKLQPLNNGFVVING